MSAPFRRRGALRGWQLHFGPNMTPMVDVVMVILIFFMASTALVGPEWLLRIGLAKKDQPNASFQLGPADLLVTVTMVRGELRFSGFGQEARPFDELARQASEAARSLGSAIEQTRVTIEARSGVSYEAVVRAHDVLTAAGFDRVALR